MRHPIAIAVLALVSVAASIAPGIYAQTDDLVDPTLPPRTRAPIAATADATEITPMAPADPKVSAIWSVGSRRYALLDIGTRVQVGDRVGERKVMRITDNEVVLQGPEGAPKVLSMFPDIEKTVRNTNTPKPTPPVRTASKTEKAK